jgi:hypothetical protein
MRPVVAPSASSGARADGRIAIAGSCRPTLAAAAAAAAASEATAIEQRARDANREETLNTLRYAAPPPPPPRRAVLLAALSSAPVFLAPSAAKAAGGLFGVRGPALGPEDARKAPPAAAGWRLTPPQGWALAYDRTADAPGAASPGPKVMWANFATLGTIVVSRATRAEAAWPAASAPGAGAQADAVVALADALLAEARDSPATYGWRVLAARARSSPPSSSSSSSSSSTPAAAAATFYDVEFVQQTCRGEVLEAAGGAKRCANPRDDGDLEVVSRHFLMSFCADPADADVVWVVRGSCPSEAWPEVGPHIAEAVATFRWPAA